MFLIDNVQIAVTFLAVAEKQWRYPDLKTSSSNATCVNELQERRASSLLQTAQLTPPSFLRIPPPLGGE
jgi:hypothetical protein